MSAGPTLPVQTGMVGGAPIIAAVNCATLARLRTVTLSADYARAPDPGYPNPNPGGEVPTLTAAPQTIPAGTTLALFSDEADALVAAGAANYA